MIKVAPSGVCGVLGSCAMDVQHWCLSIPRNSVYFCGTPESSLQNKKIKLPHKKCRVSRNRYSDSATFLPAHMARQKSKSGTLGSSLIAGLSMPHSVSWYFLRQREKFSFKKKAKKYRWHSSVSSQGAQPEGQMLALHSPVEGFVAFTVQDPGRGAVNRKHCLSNEYYSEKLVRTIMPSSWLTLFIASVHVLLKAGIVRSEQLMMQSYI